MIYKKSAVRLFEEHPCLYILAFGFVSAKITNKLVVSGSEFKHNAVTADIKAFKLFVDRRWTHLDPSCISSMCFCPQVAHMTKSEMHLHDLAFLGPGLLFLNQYFNSFIDEYLVLWIALVSAQVVLCFGQMCCNMLLFLNSLVVCVVFV